MSPLVEYRGQGVEFSYPQGWELSEESADESVTITVMEVGNFWSVTLLKRRPEAERVLAEAVEAFESEYEDIDLYPATAVVNRTQAQACNLEFVALELINCVYLRAVEAGGRTLFVMAQVTDHEREDYEKIFDAITASLRVAGDDQILID